MGWLSPKEVVRRYKQRRKTKRKEKLFRAFLHPPPSRMAGVDPIVEFSRKEVVLKTSTPVKPPEDPSMIAMLRRSSVDIWDRVEEDRREIAKRNQRCSPFLRLPPEVRNMIYNLSLGNHTFHFKDMSIHGHARLNPKAGEQHVLALLFVCHQIYSETWLLPYALNTFSFRSFEHSLTPFLDRRPYAQRLAITTIELVTYQATRMWAGPHPEGELVREATNTQAWERLPNLREIRVLVDLNESLYVEYETRGFNFSSVRDHQTDFEYEISLWRPLVLVRFLYG